MHEHGVQGGFMVMTTVMVLVENGPQGRCALKAAFLAASREGGHVVGIYPVPPSERLTPETMHFSRASLGIPGEDVRAILDRAEHKGARASRRVDFYSRK